MLDFNIFKQYYSTCHLLCGGIDVPKVAMNLAYQKFQKDFDNNTFIKVSNMIVEEVKGYRNLIPMSEWYDRKEKAELDWEENLQMYINYLEKEPENQYRQKMLSDYIEKHPTEPDVIAYKEKHNLLEAPKVEEEPVEMSAKEFLNKINFHGLKVVS